MIVPAEPRAHAHVPAVRPRANVVQFASDGVAADVRMSPPERRAGASIYSLRLATVDFDVTGELVGVLENGDSVQLGGLAVAPGSIGSARLAVAQPRSSAYQAMYLEIRSQHMLLRVEAPKPARGRAPRAVKAAGALLGAGVVALGGALAASALPQAPQIAVPPHAIAGGAVRVPYVARGYGDVKYTAVFDDGATLAQGTLSARSGDITLALPAAAAHRSISIAVQQRGIFGALVADASFAVAPPAVAETRAPGARVLSFAVRRDRDGARETILASYLAVADGGTISLLDEKGTRIASAPFAHVGTTRLSVGDAFRDRTLTAQLAVRRGGTTALASVALPANPPADAAPDDAAAPEAATPIDSASAHPLSAGIVAVEGRAVAGQSLHLRLTPRSTPTHIELQDPTGETIAETDVAAGASRAGLGVPEEQSGKTDSLVVRYTRNGAEETVLRTIAVKPR